MRLHRATGAAEWLATWLFLMVAAGCGRIGYERVSREDAAADSTTEAMNVAEARDATAPPTADGAGGSDTPVFDVPAAVDAADGSAAPDAADSRAMDAVVLSGCPGCPPGITIQDVAPSELRGAGTETQVALGCSRPNAVVGLRGAADGGPGMPTYGSIGLVCGTPVVQGGRVTIGNLTNQSVFGGSPVAFTVVCPSNQVMVGFTGASPTRLDELAITCAPLVVTGGPRTFVLAPGTPVTSVPLMHRPGSPPFAPVRCHPSQLVNGALLRGTQRIEAFGVLCGTAYHVAP